LTHLVKVFDKPIGNFILFSISTICMREYRFKRGFKPTEERLEEMILKYFGSYEKNGNVYIVRFGAIEELRLWIENKKLYAESKTNLKVSDEIAFKTLKTYNKFLEELTGYTAKERQKLLKKEIESSST